MSDLIEFKRLNFFTGFFTTADDWNQGQEYHVGKRRLHNRALHTPGIIRNEKKELRVRAKEPPDLSVLVEPGAAIDGEGNEIYLGTARSLDIDPIKYTGFTTVYIVIKYSEVETDRVENVDAPQYSGYTRITEVPVLEVTTTPPDNSTSLELARIELDDSATAITEPQHAASPDPNEIDCRHVVWAGSVVPPGEPGLTPEFEDLIQLMDRTRSDFADLAARFPVPSAIDVRWCAITIEMLASSGSLRLDHIRDVFRVLADIEKDVEQELGSAYPGLVVTMEFQAYQGAVAELLTALDEDGDYTILRSRQDKVAEAAKELTQAVFQPPVANAGPDQAVVTPGTEASVVLDASASKAFGGRTVVSYRWYRRD